MTAVIPMAAFALSAALICFLMVDKGPIEQCFQKYARYIEGHFSFLFINASPGRFAALHMIVCGLALLVCVGIASPALALLVPVLGMLPTLVLDSRQRKKRDQISEQLAPWLTVLSNSLKSSPNISDAFAASTALVQSPLRNEIDLLIKEVQLGEHLDQAMHRSARRLNSPLYSSVMTTLLVARKSGGDLPRTLQESSSTLREMERLAGVVRTKTAEGRSQTFVLALLPFVMVAALQKVDPTLVPGLLKTGAGHMVLAASMTLWLASIALARRIVKVNI